jgi:hypothetical protein
MTWNGVKWEVLQGLKTDPKFKEQFLEELNKKDDIDKDVLVGISYRIVENPNENDMSYYNIYTSKRKTDLISEPIQTLRLSKRLLRSLYIQLKQLDEKGELKP